MVVQDLVVHLVGVLDVHRRAADVRQDVLLDPPEVRPVHRDAALLAELERVADGAAGRAGRDEVPVEAIPPEKLISRPPHGAL